MYTYMYTHMYTHIYTHSHTHTLTPYLQSTPEYFLYLFCICEMICGEMSMHVMSRNPCAYSTSTTLERPTPRISTFCGVLKSRMASSMWYTTHTHTHV